jgi:hypothetical protein
MASPRQIEANRRNAQKSTGPRTQAGKARSRLNAVKHGLARKLPHEGPSEPPVLPLACAIAGEGVTDPQALQFAEQIALESHTLHAIRSRTAELLAHQHAPTSASSAPRARGTGAPHTGDILRDLACLGRYERQALTRRSHALKRLQDALAKPAEPETCRAPGE